jgi:hypothetical protein
MSTPKDKGCMRISAHDVEDPTSWTSLVDNGNMLHCPWCDVNALVRRDNGTKEIAYYRGTGAIITHMNRAYAEKLEEYSGRGDKVNLLRECAMPLTKEQPEAYENRGEGYTGQCSLQRKHVEKTNILVVETCVPFNDAYQSWYQSRTGRVSRSLDDEEDSDPKPAMRSKLQSALNDGLVRQPHRSTTVSPGHPSTRTAVHGYPLGQQLPRLDRLPVPLPFQHTSAEDDRTGSDYKKGHTERDGRFGGYSSHPPSVLDYVLARMLTDPTSGIGVMTQCSHTTTSGAPG